MRSFTTLRGFACVVCTLAMWAGCSPNQRWHVPSTEWTPAPEAHFDGAGLTRALTLADSLDTTSMLVVHRGHVAARLGDVTEGGYIASARKSILAMLFGPQVADGTIRLEETLEDLRISDVGGLLPIERRATVRDLLAARSGVYHPPSNGGDDSQVAPRRGSVEPGSYYLYNNWDFNALGTILEASTGRDVFKLLETTLALPLDMQDHDPSRHWKARDSTRSVHPAYHMVLSTRDMARLGLLMLRMGRWGEEQILPEKWIRETTRLVTPRADLNPPELRDGCCGYGFLWWVFDNPDLPPEFDGAYTAWGAFGQFITVFPAVDLVVAHKVRVPPYDRDVTIEQYVVLLKALVGALSESA